MTLYQSCGIWTFQSTGARKHGRCMQIKSEAISFISCFSVPNFSFIQFYRLRYNFIRNGKKAIFNCLFEVIIGAVITRRKMVPLNSSLTGIHEITIQIQSATFEHLPLVHNSLGKIGLSLQKLREFETSEFYIFLVHAGREDVVPEVHSPTLLLVISKSMILNDVVLK